MKVGAYLCITRVASGWRQLKWIDDSHQAVWESDYEVIKTEQELTLKEDCHSFEVNKKMDRTEQLLQIREAMHSKIHLLE